MRVRGPSTVGYDISLLPSECTWRDIAEFEVGLVVGW